MREPPLVQQLRERFSDSSLRSIRRALTGLWILSILGVLSVAVYFTFVGVDVPHARAERQITDYILPVGLSFFAEYVDTSLGMGYGTTLTGLLILLGFPVTQVVVAVLVSEFASGGIAAVSHHLVGNADLRTDRRHFRLAMLLGGLGLAGGFASATMAVRLPEGILDTAVGGLILSMGIVIFVARRLRLRFSWGRAAALGLIAGANKGFMGGGYGPLIVAGQIATGDSMRSAIAVTALSEALACVGGIAGYLVMRAAMPWLLIVALLIGATLASVLAAATVRALPKQGLKSVVGAVLSAAGRTDALRLVNLRGRVAPHPRSATRQSMYRDRSSSLARSASCEST
ncbi:MAG: TSUP family transporter [Armatimonadota bacterium]